MADVLVNDRSLMDIGDALRRKYGETKPGKEPINVPFLYEVNAPADLELSGGVYLKDIEVNAPGAVQYQVSIKFETISGSVNYREVYVMNGTNNYYYTEDKTSTITSNNGKLTLRVQMSNFGVNNGHSYKVNFTLYPLDADGNIREDIDIELPNTYLVSEMSGAIDDIIPYVEPVVESITIKGNGTYTPSIGVDGFNEVVVDIEIPTGDLPDEAFILSGDCSYRFASDGWNWFINTYGSQIKCGKITNLGSMFYYSDNLENISFTIDMSANTSSVSATNMFKQCSELKSLPKIINYKPSVINDMFASCSKIKNIPDDYADTWDWSEIDNATTTYSCSMGSMFSYCSSLRKLPMKILEHGNPNPAYSYSIYSSMASNCKSLDDIVDLPFPHYNSVWTSNALSTTATMTHRLKDFTFKLQDDGTPYIANWKKQTLDLSNYVGFASSRSSIVGSAYNNGITADKEVKDDATYQALKDDPDWFATNIDYSRYNHTSAVNTINSMPDTSAAGGGNTIKFNRYSGAKTDGGAIGNLTEEEIAVAAAKGWTITFA